MSKPKSTPATPREALFEYYRALLALNAFAMAEAHDAKQHGRELDIADLRARRAAIRERFCTKRRRKTDDVVGYGLLDVKAYDPSNTVVEREEQPSKTRSLITVRNVALRERYKYLLVLRGGSWLVDSVKFRDRQKWVPVSLN